MSYQRAYQLSIVGGLIPVNLNPRHELIVLAEQIRWEEIAEKLEPFYSVLGRRAKTSRLLVGLLLIKHLYDLSDEELVQRIDGDLYFQVFCGIDPSARGMKYRRILHPSTLSKCRKRLGPEGLVLVEKIIRDYLIEKKFIKTRTQIVDSTVMEKNVHFPTDAHNLNEGRKRLVKGIKRLRALGLDTKLRRTFSRKAKQAMVRDAKLSRKGGPERMQEIAKQLIRFGNEVLKSVPGSLQAAPTTNLSSRQLQEIQRAKKQLREDSDSLRRLIYQTEMKHQNVHVKEKLYSLHEKHIRAIRKGKLNKNFEFGIITTLSADPNGYIVAHREYDRNVHDADTLETALRDWKKATGRLPMELGADRGYARRKHSRLIESIPRLAIPPLGPVKHPDHKKSYFRRLCKRRTAIEPVISHLKNDHRFNRSRYKGFRGDKINATLSVTAWNLRKMARDELKRAA